MFQDSEKLCGCFGLTSSLLIPSLLVVGSMLQSPYNLKPFGAYMDKWICLVLFPPLPGRPSQNLQQVSMLE